MNLGIKVPPEQLIEAVARAPPGHHRPLRPAGQERAADGDTAGDLAAVGIDTPLLVGGAALTRRFTHRKIAPAYGGVCTYAKDAMHGLKLVERLMDGGPARAGAGGRGPARQPTVDAAARPPSRPKPRHARRPASCAATCRCRRRPTSRATPERLDLDAVWAATSTRRCSTASTSDSRARCASSREQGDPKLAKLEAVIERAEGAGPPGGDAGQGGLALLPRAGGGRPR